ncbi:MAG: sugar transferase [Rhizobiaceae bacterium]
MTRLTGWAQVNGRNALSRDEKFTLDVWYVDNHALWLDLKIIFISLRKIAERDGMNHAR